MKTTKSAGRLVRPAFPWFVGAGRLGLNDLTQCLRRSQVWNTIW